MHSAPAVRYPVPRSARAGRLFAVLCGLPVLPCLFWWVAGARVSLLAAVGAAWLLAAGVGALQWQRMHAGQLGWDGQAWWWLPSDAPGHDGHAVHVDVRLDMQSAVLVHMDGAPATARWRWLARDAAPQRWSALRRALYQRSAATAGMRTSDRP